jgi:hypothetical protein
MNVRSCKDDVYIEIYNFFPGTVLLNVSRSWCQLGLIIKKTLFFFKKKVEALLAHVKPGCLHRELYELCSTLFG